DRHLADFFLAQGQHRASWARRSLSGADDGDRDHHLLHSRHSAWRVVADPSVHTADTVQRFWRAVVHPARQYQGPPERDARPLLWRPAYRRCVHADAGTPIAPRILRLSPPAISPRQPGAV